MSGFNKNTNNPNIMEVPTYDNGMGYTPPSRTIPARKPEVNAVPRVQPQRVVHSSKTSLPAPHVAPLNTIKRKPVATAPGKAMYLNRPLPPLPGCAQAASKPQGISKVPTLNLNKPLPPIPHTAPLIRPAPNGVYSSTGQRIAVPVERSAWSNTTESTRAVRRRQKRDKNLQSHGAAILHVAKPGKTTKAPELLKTHATVGKPGQDRSRVQDSKWSATQAAERYNRQREEDIAQRRLAAARRAIIPGRYGIHQDTFRTPEWRALTGAEKSMLSRQYEQGLGRKQPESLSRERKSPSKCSVM